MIDQTLTMIPGPTPVHPRILGALARPTVSHVVPEFVEAFRAAIADCRRLRQSREGQPFIVAGGGTLALEMGLVNVVEPGERILVISQGYFGDRYAELAGVFGIQADVVRSEWGQAVAPEVVAARLAAGGYAAVTITHVDTSTGTAAPAASYCELLRGRKELVILDGVCATGGIAEPCDTWGVDVLVTAPQKAIGAPPGLALCLFSPRAMARRRERTSLPPTTRTSCAGCRSWKIRGVTTRRRASTRSSRSPRRCAWCGPRAWAPASSGTRGWPARSALASKRSALRCSPHPTAVPIRSPWCCFLPASRTPHSGGRWRLAASWWPVDWARSRGRRSDSVTWATSDRRKWSRRSSHSRACLLYTSDA